MNFSTRSVNRMAPTLSLLFIALNASTADSSVSKSICVRSRVPPRRDALTSMSKNTVSSRSSSNTFTWGVPVRAVTFQSMVLTSSPAWYSRFSAKAIPRPLNALLYSPEKIRSLNFRVVISTRRTRFNNSAASISLGQGRSNQKGRIKGLRRGPSIRSKSVQHGCFQLLPRRLCQSGVS